jgi:Outer membrane protein beta-barrel domain
MRKAFLAAAILWAVFLHVSHSSAQAQTDPPKIEVGGQFTFINLKPATFNGVSQNTTSDLGVGGRTTFNLNKTFSLEAEVNFFPSVNDENPILGARNNGRKVEALFGGKAGIRREKYGLFAKVRPGLMHFSEVFDCLGPMSPDLRCGPHPKTEFALDVGGVAEYYPSRHVALRLDVGDTIIYFAERHFFEADLSPLPETLRARITNNLQFNVGVAYRF